MDPAALEQFKKQLEEMETDLRAAVEGKAVANGTYGLCRRCQGPIAIERLEAQPDAVPCVKCAAAARR